MDVIPYETSTYYVFDRGYYDLKHLFHINEIGFFFVIRPKSRMQYKVITNNANHDTSGILSDQEIELTSYVSNKKYPEKLRRVVYYAETLNRTFIYITNNFEISAKQIALLYKYRWKVELFFKWIKQHLKIKSFWGTTKSAVHIQIFTTITTYCMVAFVEHDLQLHRSTYEVLRILNASLLDKTPIKELLFQTRPDVVDDGQLTLNFI